MDPASWRDFSRNWTFSSLKRNFFARPYNTVARGSSPAGNFRRLSAFRQITATFGKTFAKVLPGGQATRAPRGPLCVFLKPLGQRSTYCSCRHVPMCVPVPFCFFYSTGMQIHYVLGKRIVNGGGLRTCGCNRMVASCTDVSGGMDGVLTEWHIAKRYRLNFRPVQKVAGSLVLASQAQTWTKHRCRCVPHPPPTPAFNAHRSSDGGSPEGATVRPLWSESRSAMRYRA